MKKLMVGAVVAMAAVTALAATRSKPEAMPGNDEMETKGRAADIFVGQVQLGQGALASAPNINGLKEYFKKPRHWIVLKTKYTTRGTDEGEGSRFLDQLTFTWHVLLDTKTAKENKGNREKLAPYSYFTTTVTYFNIPAGDHGASVVLPPSYLERYGEPKAVGLEISNEKGDTLWGDSWSEIKGIDPGTKFWEDSKIMNAKTEDGNPMIERRQGLVDRSKTIWGLVCPNDYEATIQ